MSRILLFTDDLSRASALRSGLEAEGCAVVAAGDAGAGLAAAARGGFDLVLLDRSAAGGGLDVLRRLRASGDPTPVIVLSDRGEEGDRGAALRLGADDHLAHPFAPGELMARIRARTRMSRRVSALNGALASAEDGDLDAVLDALAESARSATGAERSLVLLADGTAGLRPAAVRGGAAGARYCTSVARRVLVTGRSEALIDAEGECDCERGGSVRDLKLRRVLCAPLRRNGTVAGVLYADSRLEPDGWGRSDLKVFEAVAAQCASALERDALFRERRHLREEMRAAGTVQRAMQPVLPGDGSAVEIAGLSRPREEAGGDYLDALPDGEGGWIAVLGDAAGHGIAAALCMSAARSLVRALLPRTRGLAELLGEVNRGLVRDMAHGTFMTLFLARVDPATGELRYASAGHGGALVYRAATRACEELPPTGPALGILADADYRSERAAPLGPGDLLLLFTDGVDEAAGPEGRFGVERIREVLRHRRAADGHGLVEQLADAVERFAGPDGARDDLSLLVVRGAAGNGAASGAPAA